MCIFPKAPDNSAELARQRAEALQRRRQEAGLAADAKAERLAEEKSRVTGQRTQSLFRIAQDTIGSGARTFFAPIGG